MNVNDKAGITLDLKQTIKGEFSNNPVLKHKFIIFKEISFFIKNTQKNRKRGFY